MYGFEKLHVGAVRRSLQGASVAVTLLLTVSVAQAAAAANVVDDAVYMKAQRLVQVDNGRKVNLYCSGSGRPAVILESGLSDPNFVWGSVQPAIAKRARVCSYDRAGIGYSDASGRASTSANIVEDLRAVLRAGGVAPPYVLVGHSFGGLNVRLYAYRYPAEVAGIVLVDSSHEDEAARYLALNGPDIKTEQRLARHRACAAAAPKGLVAGTELYNKCVDGPNGEPNAYFGSRVRAALAAQQARPAFQSAQLSELENMDTVSADQVRKARRSYGSLPLLVFTSGAQPQADCATRQATDECVQWQLHEELAHLSTSGAHRAVAEAGHYIQLDRPDVIVDGVGEILNRIDAARR